MRCADVAVGIACQRGEGGFCFRERIVPCGKDPVVALGFAAAFRRGLTEPGLHEPAALEPRERRVDGADRDVLPV